MFSLIYPFEVCYLVLGLGDMGLKIYHDISGIYCDNDINNDNYQ